LRLTPDFLEAMQELLWPVTLVELDRPSDLLMFESNVGPTVRVDPVDATWGVATLILKLRQIGLDYREKEARKCRLTAIIPNADAPLTYHEVGAVKEYWRGKFLEQPLTQKQAKEDMVEGNTKNNLRQKMRSRFTSYQHRALGNRTLGWALITYGFKVDMQVLAKAYHDQKTESGDASSLPSDNKWLRKQVLRARSWFRWGRQLYCSNVARDSLPPYAQSALHWYRKGWSADECDRLARKYGHGMIRAGPERGSFLGQEAHGSIVDRMRRDPRL
jgi:hypothetical protein